LREAMYWKQVPVGKTRCLLCPHRCLLANNKTGICLVRQNKDGVLYTKVYGKVSSYSSDPVEKKPLYHFYPGSQIFSIGTWGCNLKCTMCQNWNISQQEVSTEEFSPDDIAGIAKENKAIGVAYTYNEPFIWYEYVLDCSKKIHEAGMKNVLVTNGFVSEEPLKEILPYIDAFNIDLKASGESFYREVCGAQLSPVMRTIKNVYESKTHLELTYLVIPTLNDRIEEIAETCDWIASISKDIPVHFSRYFPQYKMDIDPTPIATLLKVYEIAKSRLNYVYLGNISSDKLKNETICPNCGNTVITREFPDIEVSGMKEGFCGKCGEKIYGAFE